MQYNKKIIQSNYYFSRATKYLVFLLKKLSGKEEEGGKGYWVLGIGDEEIMVNG